jgi:hypothetical protein
MGCDDGNPCTSDSCTSIGCIHTSLPGGTPCVLPGECVGVCFPGSWDGRPGVCGCSGDATGLGCGDHLCGDPICNDYKPCTYDYQAMPGVCSHQNTVNGLYCNVPGGLGVCLYGECCIGVIDTSEMVWRCISCDDGNPCTWDTGYDGCLHFPLEGDPCENGTCNSSGECLPP